MVSLKGRVVNAVTAEPVARALVECAGIRQDLKPSQSPEARQLSFSERTFTDATGAFALAALPAGNCSLAVTRPQFRSNTQYIQLDSETKSLEIRMAPFSVFSGKVTDTEGKPLRGVNIVLYRVDIQQGRRVITQFRSVGTNDLGQYRLWNLSEGKYLLKAAGRTGGTMLFSNDLVPAFSLAESFVPVYYGGSVDRQSASQIDLQQGQTVTADFHLSMLLTRRIRGVLSGIAAFKTVSFEVLDSHENVVATRAALGGAGGRFELLDVPQGKYLLRVSQSDGDTKVYGAAQVSIDNVDAEDVAIPLGPGPNVKVISHCQEISLRAMGPNCGGLTIFKDDNPALDVSDQRPAQNVAPGDYGFNPRSFGEYVTSIQVGNQQLRPNQTLSLSSGTTAIEMWMGADGGSVEVSLEVPDVSAGPFANGFSFLAVPLFDSIAGPAVFPKALLQFASLMPGDYMFYAFRNADIQQLEYRNPEVLRGLSPGTALRVEPKGKHKLVIRSLAK